MQRELPNDPVMLMSFVNTKLRDAYDSFADFCADYGVEADALKERLRAAGFCYNAAQNQFR